jgi:hypothetical protein
MAIQIPIEDAIKNLGLPSNSKFLGYVVHLPDQDEFLAFSEENELLERSVFSQTPELAKIYDDYHSALKDSSACKYKAEPWLLFDSDNKLIIAPID